MKVLRNFIYIHKLETINLRDTKENINETTQHKTRE
jgi:hypothetical protein